MKIKRTANAGVLLEIDGISILIDGVCKELNPYLGTPDDIKKALSAKFPDVMLVTHYHSDHYDEEFSSQYKTNTLRSVYGPEFALVGKMGNVKINGVPTRHIGKSDAEHVSYVISGTKTVWFMGDASPLDIKNFNYPQPDVIIVPYAYVTTKTSWEITKSTGCKNIILVHLPSKDNDPHNLWKAMEETVGSDNRLVIPEIGEVVTL